jgi:hypothetical protein
VLAEVLDERTQELGAFLRVGRRASSGCRVFRPRSRLLDAPQQIIEETARHRYQTRQRSRETKMPWPARERHVTPVTRDMHV